MTSSRPAPTAAGHVVVVGAGVVGLGAAAEAHRRGYRVTVVEQAASVVGASVQNFGHVGVTAQAGPAREYALAARERWLSLGSAAGFAVARSGTHVVARTSTELRLLEEFAAERGGDEVHLLDAAQTRSAAPVRPEPVVGGAYLPLDLQVDPRVAAPALAAWLESQGVTFRWRTAARAVGTGRVETTTGRIDADVVIVAAHHDLDRLLPDVAAQAQVRRCRLHMLRVRPSGTTPGRAGQATTGAGTPGAGSAGARSTGARSAGARSTGARSAGARSTGAGFAGAGFTGPVLTGWSMVRYAALAACPSASLVADELAAADPVAAGWDVNLMLTPQRDGTLVVGDTHLRAIDAPVFQDEEGYAVLLRLVADLLGTGLDVVERWQGTYATAPEEFLVAEPEPGVHVATVTTGIGMTTGLGLAAHVLDQAGLTD
ncbi:FAD dependent oxidoreductase TIGR03364 [Promicromonospora umidemergens]|uniref:FAD dependent oxidoreductase domain-containing protein n=1 Tax=Promicromonospora umidemergens TaxID=629679 RepID=A0ABP8XLV7_9MICO|nr:FAD-dependent oxidoreductase [Promicromonospora umidemergens]MCP2282188.1 FAD dependent oxidoreductase TIGR03364 [Promicromonospora umidemergens]